MKQYRGYQVPEGYEEFTTSYIAAGTHQYDDMLERALLSLADVEFDTVVGTGLSGALVVPRLASDLLVEWAVVRKPTDNSHAFSAVEGRIGRKWLFVDDLIDTGTTLLRVHNIIRRECNAVNWETEYVGAWTYTWDKGFIPPGSEHIEPDAVRAVNEEFGEDED